MPAPVGPVTSTAPWSWVIARSRRARSAASMPSRSSSGTTPLLVENAHHDRFAAHHGQRRHPDVDVAPVDGEADPTVLRGAPLGDVELGHDLDPGDEAGGQPPRHGGRVGTTPSTRKRTRMSPSRGSKWMSEAPRLTPSAMIEWTSLTTGASSADSRSSITSSAEVVSRLLLDLLHRLLEVGELADHGLDVLGRGHCGPDLVAGGDRDVVEAEHVGGVRGGDQDRVRSSRKATGIARKRRAAGALSRLAAPLSTSKTFRSTIVEAVAVGERPGELVGAQAPLSTSASPIERPWSLAYATAASTTSRSANPSSTTTSPSRRRSSV